jgi:DtxR family Mn-dependent transcriptional regulator
MRKGERQVPRTQSAGKLSASLEDYLEVIYHLLEDNQAARARDIAKRMRVRQSSVTGALHALAERRLVNYAPYEYVTLTDEGRAAAADIVRRHEALRKFFVEVLAMDDAEADKAACRMEHAVSADLVERFVQFVEFVEKYPPGDPKRAWGFGEYLGQNGSPRKRRKERPR